MPWQRSRRIGGKGTPTVVRPRLDKPTHIDQRADELVRKQPPAPAPSKKKERRAEVRFTKLTDGQWGVLGPRWLLKPGKVVTVVAKGGRKSPMRVVEVVEAEHEWAKARVERF